jgi:phosphopantothenoylcysteine synthetase/decarboxylase
LIVTGAPLTARAVDLVGGLQGAGWDVVVAATEAARPWVDADRITAATGSPPRYDFRDPSQPRIAGRPDVVVIAPATFNTVNKLATGIADTFAHTVACEAIGADTRVVVVPMASVELWSHPAMERSLEVLRQAGVRLVDVRDGGEKVTPIRIEDGVAVVAGFDPAWLVTATGEPGPSA